MLSVQLLHKVRYVLMNNDIYNDALVIYNAKGGGRSSLHNVRCADQCIHRQGGTVHSAHC